MIVGRDKLDEIQARRDYDVCVLFLCAISTGCQAQDRSL